MSNGTDMLMSRYRRTKGEGDMSKKMASLEEAQKFLMQRGLTRDRANYVSLVIEYRQAMVALKRLTKDQHVRDCIDGMIEITGCEVSEIYEMQQADDKYERR